MAINTRKAFYNAITNIDTTKIYSTSKLVYNVIGQYAPINKAIVGANAFAHEAGIHQHGVLANRETYEIMTPQSVGVITNNMVFGKHSGKHAIEVRLNELGYDLTRDEMNSFFERFKNLADKKKKISDNDLEALLIHKENTTTKGYKLDRFTVNTGSYITTNAVVRLNCEGELIEEVSIGDGPIDAAFKAIDKIVKIENHFLDDYTIQSVTEGNDALGEVCVKIKYKDKIYVGRGLSTDVIEASLLAYVNGMNKAISG